MYTHFVRSQAVPILEFIQQRIFRLCRYSLEICNAKWIVSVAKPLWKLSLITSDAISMRQCENIRFINLNIFKNFEHVYRRLPFDVLLPLRAKGFIAFSITINTTQFPFKRYAEETSKRKYCIM